jgi:hypothetical protein
VEKLPAMFGWASQWYVYVVPGARVTVQEMLSMFATLVEQPVPSRFQLWVVAVSLTLIV